MKLPVTSVEGKLRNYCFTNFLIESKRSKYLTLQEREKIRRLSSQGLSYRKIMNEANVTYGQVAKLLAGKTFTGKKEQRGRKSKLKLREKLKVRRLATKKMLSPAKIIQELKLSVSKRTIQRQLQ